MGMRPNYRPRHRCPCPLIRCIDRERITSVRDPSPSASGQPYVGRTVDVPAVIGQESRMSSKPSPSSSKSSYHHCIHRHRCRDVCRVQPVKPRAWSFPSKTASASSSNPQPDPHSRQRRGLGLMDNKLTGLTSVLIIEDTVAVIIWVQHISQEIFIVIGLARPLETTNVSKSAFPDMPGIRPKDLVGGSLTSSSEQEWRNGRPEAPAMRSPDCREEHPFEDLERWCVPRQALMCLGQDAVRRARYTAVLQSLAKGMGKFVNEVDIGIKLPNL